MADTNQYNPLKGGASIGPCRAVGGFVFAGTLGAIVTDNATGAHMLLSNFHVMCVDNGWHVGDEMCQPSRVDGGSCPADDVGALQRAVLSASVDGAVSSISGRPVACEILDIGAVTGTASAVLNAPVRKRGRTTGLTYGFVDSVSLSVNVDYGDGIGSRTLTNQIGLRPDTIHNPTFGDHGDSGSVVVNDSVQVVGLYFAGSDDGFGVANPIAAVLAALNISLCVPKPPLRDTLKELRKDPISDPTIKEIRKEPIKDPITYKDIRKEPVLDTLKEIRKEPVIDTLKEVTGDPTLAEVVGPVGPGPVEQQRNLAVPFVMAGGSQFGGGAGYGASGAGGNDVQMLADAIVALQQQYEELMAAYDAAVQAAGGGSTS